MRPTRVVLALVATALAPALLLTTPAVAASAATTVSTTSTADMSDDDLRVAIARILAAADPKTDKAVIREANEALDANTPEALRAFLKTGYRLAVAEDDRVRIFRILATADPKTDKAVIREVNETLDADTPEALRAFLETGYRLAVAEDDRVRVARILADPTISEALRAAAEAVIDGTPEELRYFIEVGQYEV
ncbi:ALF repeat-containing protein [Streptomyces lanatus]|uniref:ALF repeat-containing protein n=1 Tax=Streptomyces lanatus TaxID=66900 RepID=A0ABV1XUZ2_9ACTN|nr:ALF repeat-containing protein [Streptomyces lanatus]GHH13204.1 hypothetical protein GCM10018780_52650 [Streptomyces lanatus]